ncbi:MAG: hypothetical protein ACLUEQ_00990 [Cloacibacillus evryensis]
MERNAGGDHAAELKAARAEGFVEALGLVRYVLKLKKMGVSDCEIIKKFQLDPTFIHELMEWMK